MQQVGQAGRKKIDILGVRIDRVTMDGAAGRVEDMLKTNRQHYIVTPNPELVMLAQKDHEFKNILNSADMAIPDGIGLIWASRLISPHNILKERVTGTDLMVRLCEMGAREGKAVYLLGGKNNIPQQAARILKERFPNLRISGSSSQDPDLPLHAYQIPPTDLLFVAYGAPTQEKWIAQNLKSLPVKVAMGVGGAFDFITGKQKRSPKIFQNLWLEWLWRLITEPWRWRRQTALLKFVYSVIKEKIRRKP